MKNHQAAMTKRIEVQKDVRLEQRGVISFESLYFRNVDLVINHGSSGGDVNVSLVSLV